MPDNARTIIGKVLSAHGIRGDVKVSPLTDYPERYSHMKELSLYREGQLIGVYPIKRVRPASDYLIISLEGISDVEQADKLRGCTIEILKTERTNLPKGEFWISDLTGLDAKTEDGVILGKVKDIVSSGASQLIIIEDSAHKVHLIPANREFFLDANLEERYITLRLIDGLWDL